MTIWRETFLKPGQWFFFCEVTCCAFLRSCRWRYRQPADHSPWGAVEDAGSASTAAVDLHRRLAADHGAALLQPGQHPLCRPHGWVTSRVFESHWLRLSVHWPRHSHRQIRKTLHSHIHPAWVWVCCTYSCIHASMSLIYHLISSIMYLSIFTHMSMNVLCVSVPCCCCHCCLSC